MRHEKPTLESLQDLHELFKNLKCSMLRNGGVLQVFQLTKDTEYLNYHTENGVVSINENDCYHYIRKIGNSYNIDIVNSNLRLVYHDTVDRTAKHISQATLLNIQKCSTYNRALLGTVVCKISDLIQIRLPYMDNPLIDLDHLQELDDKLKLQFGQLIRK